MMSRRLREMDDASYKNSFEQKHDTKSDLGSTTQEDQICVLHHQM